VPYHYPAYAAEVKQRVFCGHTLHQPTEPLLLGLLILYLFVVLFLLHITIYRVTTLYHCSLLHPW